VSSEGAVGAMTEIYFLIYSFAVQIENIDEVRTNTISSEIKIKFGVLCFSGKNRLNRALDAEVNRVNS
jgi:hypothetical protein